ncbi:hypothetical protein A8M32_27510 [Sinorhizobium alkalisoli]|uniref:Uncharacterized protein n=1 Tax=Sinorhizobium alkalisoli TaxID=1752398 RepID=A0A1E3V568_9HYPH|nr:hypothetical protein A8M32_27510 [Sinorhizobium alkalisoli]
MICIVVLFLAFKPRLRALLRCVCLSYLGRRPDAVAAAVTGGRLGDNPGVDSVGADVVLANGAGKLLGERIERCLCLRQVGRGENGNAAFLLGRGANSSSAARADPAAQGVIADSIQEP